jgi:putative colanic acid biosynthesis acetyltransferase WcaF
MTSAKAQKINPSVIGRRSLATDRRLKPGKISVANRVARMLWNVVYLLLFRPSPTIAHPWRRLLLRLFGAKIGRRAEIYPSARIWAPWHLEMAEHTSIGPHVLCYSVDRIAIARYGEVSQFSYLCTASHDINSTHLDLVTAPIHIGAYCWVAADAYIGPSVVIGEGAVVGARACVFKDVAAWTVVGGNPAQSIGSRSRAITARTLTR